MYFEKFSYRPSIIVHLYCKLIRFSFSMILLPSPLPFLPFYPSILPSFLGFHPSFLPSYRPSFLPSLLSFFRPSFLPSLLSSFPPFFLPSFFPSFLPSSLTSFFSNNSTALKFLHLYNTFPSLILYSLPPLPYSLLIAVSA